MRIVIRHLGWADKGTVSPIEIIDIGVADGGLTTVDVAPSELDEGSWCVSVSHQYQTGIGLTKLPPCATFPPPTDEGRTTFDASLELLPETAADRESYIEWLEANVASLTIDGEEVPLRRPGLRRRKPAEPGNAGATDAERAIRLRHREATISRICADAPEVAEEIMEAFRRRDARAQASTGTERPGDCAERDARAPEQA